MLSRRSVIVSGGAIAAAAIGYGLWPRMDTYQAAVEEQRRALLPDAALADLVRMGTLAANGHNTQPCRFRLDPGRVTILPDFTRRTKVVDPDDHHLFVSLGCAAENLSIAAEARGRRATVGATLEGRVAVEVTPLACSTPEHPWTNPPTTHQVPANRCRSTAPLERSIGASP